MKKLTFLCIGFLFILAGCSQGEAFLMMVKMIMSF